jgi:hypothetical protein
MNFRLVAAPIAVLYMAWERIKRFYSIRNPKSSMPAKGGAFVTEVP